MFHIGPHQIDHIVRGLRLLFQHRQIFYVQITVPEARENMIEERRQAIARRLTHPHDRDISERRIPDFLCPAKDVPLPLGIGLLVIQYIAELLKLKGEAQ